MADVVVSEHHFILSSKQNRFTVITADSLLPYLVTVGKWKVKLLYLSGALNEATDKFGGFRITSPFITTEKGKKLTLASFGAQEYRGKGNVWFFDIEARTITHKTDHLIFELETLSFVTEETPPEPLPKNLVLAIALIQVR
jgi:hypothetical protein